MCTDCCVDVARVVTKVILDGARRKAMGGTLLGCFEPARTLVRCKGEHYQEPVHRSGDE